MTPLPARAQVLVIDDEVSLGRSIKRALRHHDVALLEDGDAALARLREGELPHLVLCDLMMPGRSGMDLFEALSRCRPEALERMVFMTGGSFTPECERFLEVQRVSVINKPFPEGALADLVARALERIA